MDYSEDGGGGGVVDIQAMRIVSYLWSPQSVHVGDVENAVCRGRVDTARPPLLEAKLLQDDFEPRILRTGDYSI